MATSDDDRRGGSDEVLRMLWQPSARPTRGPKPKLTLEQLVDAAIELADEVGLEAMSMRAVARALDVGAMSLYRYVPSKETLVELMFDTVLRRQPRAHELPGGWREQLEATARIDLAFYMRHPWVLEISGARPPLGPGTFDVYESVLRVVADTGLTKAELSPAVSSLAAFVRGAAHGELMKARAVRESGISDEEWWGARDDFWQHHFDPERYPTITAIYTAGGYENAPDEFEFGLQRLLDGLAVLIDRRAGG
ncbi:MAG TPA: TetR/AcrR family transcriptional regulator [Conexibacter sp.]|nr:TetR/AcrR family transcriptional regulator [Conexibacter sp.]